MGTAVRVVRTAARVLLGGFLVFAGVAHFAVTDEFLAQVPPVLPAPEAVVLISGVVEIVAGLAVLCAPLRLGGRSWRPAIGVGVAALFVLVFPGNVSQYLTGADGFGLDTDGARATRLLFQPLLVAWALWACSSWPLLRRCVGLSPAGRSGRGSPGSP
ncbi:hypothetical protein ACLFMI_10250 [Pseudonocardia nantongensis]|uniref:DoxX family protein n=1 Tax=Pseudonocardia nantongensis TaxID=1181885 RepID=UPI00397DA474